MKKEEKNYGLLKGILILVLVAILLTWLFLPGQFNGSELITESSLKRIGLTDLPIIVSLGFEMALDKILLLFAMGGFYGILSKTKGYDKLTSSIAKKLEKHKKATVVVISCILAILTSFLTECFAVLVFVPFIVSIMKKMKLNKMTILASTIGSMILGILGATYGTKGLVVMIKYNYFAGEGFDSNATILIRAGILVIALILFNFFNLSLMKKKDKDTELEEKASENTIDEKKKTWIPIIIIGVILLILVILGFTNWSNWKGLTHTNKTTGMTETIFEGFHNTVEDIKIGDDFAIISSILGANFEAFGLWNLYILSAILFIFTIIIGICYRFKFSEFVSSFTSGCKKAAKPAIFLMGAYLTMAVAYNSMHLSSIGNKIISLADGFNIATSGLALIVCNLFATDLDFTGFVLATFLAAEYSNYMNVLYVMISTLYGFMSLFLPTSILLGVGLTYSDIKYKEWLKFIWKFLIGMFICLLIIFILMVII